ncbi:CD209 antigen-like protein D [Nematolebias whitei]|uniref:CD209 antigen-like protein D n=1 Tax=Nematolebias whitei TaxID=451745 RepID=UPI00189A70E6|nr:CD209 antigen-like protein D [Nematolebias whitei]
MSTSGTPPDRMYSKLIDDGCQDDFRTDVQPSDYPVFPVRVPPRMSGPGPYRFATICLAALCAVLLISIIAVTVHYKSKAQAGVEATSDMQKGNANISEINTKLREENTRLRKKVDELMANVTALMTNKVIKPTAVECPKDWHLFSNSCYLIPKLTRNWHGSQDYCQTQGAHLAIILTAEEQTFLWNLLPRGHWNSYWFGITDGETEDVWKWIDGSPLVGGFWEPNEPNNHINEDCGYIVKTEVLERVATKSWYDAPCSMYLPFICEKEMGANAASH